MATSPIPPTNDDYRLHDTNRARDGASGVLTDGAAINAPTLPETPSSPAGPEIAAVQREQAETSPDGSLATHCDPSPPSFPGYAIEGVLGRGGMGIVYKAHQLKANRVVAIKMILTSKHASVQEQVRFQMEAEAVAPPAPEYRAIA